DIEPAAAGLYSDQHSVSDPGLDVSAAGIQFLSTTGTQFLSATDIEFVPATHIELSTVCPDCRSGCANSRSGNQQSPGGVVGKHSRSRPFLYFNQQRSGSTSDLCQGPANLHRLSS